MRIRNRRKPSCRRSSKNSKLNYPVNILLELFNTRRNIKIFRKNKRKRAYKQS